MTKEYTLEEKYEILMATIVVMEVTMENAKECPEDSLAHIKMVNMISEALLKLDIDCLYLTQAMKGNIYKHLLEYAEKEKKEKSLFNRIKNRLKQVFKELSLNK